MPNKKEQQTPSTNSPANIIIFIGESLVQLQSD